MNKDIIQSAIDLVIGLIRMCGDNLSFVIHLSSILDVSWWRTVIEPVHEITNNLGSDQVRHKPL